MSSIVTIVLIGLSLSMDAFSLAIVYGVIGLTKKDKIILSTIVGIYHFIMPQIGLSLGILIDNITFINLHIIASIILLYIGIDLIVSKMKKDDIKKPNIINFIIFGLSVSIDSLTIGIGLKAITNKYLLSSIIFSIFSLTLTYIGLVLGTYIGEKIGDYAKILGGTILIILAIIMIIN